MSNDESNNQRASGPDTERSADQPGGESGSRKRRRRRRGGRSKKPGAERAGQATAGSDQGDASRARSGDAPAAPRKRRRRRRRGDRDDRDKTTAGGDHEAPESADRGDSPDRSRRRAAAPPEPNRRKRRRRRRGRRGEEESGPVPAVSWAADPGAADVPPGVGEGSASEAADSEPAKARPGTEDLTDDDLEIEADDPVLPDELAVDEPGDDDPDPVTFGMEQIEVDERAPLDADVRNLVGVKFSPAGRIYLYDSGDRYYRRGDEVVVDSDRGPRVGTVAVDSAPRVRGQGHQALKRVLRVPNRNDRRTLDRNRERSERALHAARQHARELGLPIKVFRAEYAHSGKKVRVYFTSEERIDFRELVRRLTSELKSRVEMRQTGVRDEAKMVGGIGSCGRELCCTTWLPEFVPVSIKMAKDQGLVLNPTKVSGQCGRLKCCLVYEQATYAELRKGLPKLGKRVITEAGEGRVVEVDVLRQRVRVSLGPGEFQVFPGHEVKPMFPSQPQKKSRK